MCHEITDDRDDVLAQHLLIGQHDVNGLRSSAEALGAFAVLAGEIADLRRRCGIADSQFCEDPVFLGVVIDLGIDLEIRNDGANDLVVRPFGATKNIQFMFEDIEQPSYVAMLSIQ